MIYRHYLVSGRVQGVGFRRFVEREAGAQNLKGGTRNLRDGRVEVLASGPSDSLEIFGSALSRGPTASSVSQIEKHDLSGEALQRLLNLFGAGFFVHEDGERPWL